MTAPLRVAEIIAVGSEMLGWTRLDTNSLFITQALAGLGIEVRAKAVVGDDRARLGEMFGDAHARADLVVLTGGLGPTDDDLTREVIAQVLRLDLVEDPEITARIRARFERRGLVMPEINRRQAMVPAGAMPLMNANGTAPGLFIPAREGKVVLLLPGPPRELQPILRAVCEPGGLLESGATSERLHSVSLFTTGRSESHVEQATQPIYTQWKSASTPIETTILAGPGQVELHLTLRSADADAAQRILTDARAKLVAALGDCVFSTDGRILPEVVLDLLRARTLTFAAAESCTGGLLMQRLTDVAGSSAVVRGGIVAYNNELKTRLLDVDERLIATHGAVSEPVAVAMADGVRARTGADVCVAITGVAGPGGGSAEKPVGTVVIAVQVPDKPLHVRTHLFPGGRDIVRLQASQAALDRIRRLLD